MLLGFFGIFGGHKIIKSVLKTPEFLNQKEEMNSTLSLPLTDFTNSSPLPSLINPHKFEYFGQLLLSRADAISSGSHMPVSWLSEFDSSQLGKSLMWKGPHD